MQIRHFLLGMLCLTQVGCATTLTGQTEEIFFTSEPEGATVKIDGQSYGKTPIKVSLQRAKGAKTISFELEGYKKSTRSLSSAIQLPFWGNFLLSYSSTTGAFVDMSNGAMYEYSPKQYYVTLVKEEDSTGSVEDVKSQIKTFIVRNHQNIIIEASQRKGESLNILMTSLNINHENQQAFIKDLNKLSQTYSDAVEFADHLMNIYEV